MFLFSSQVHFAAILASLQSSRGLYAKEFPIYGQSRLGIYTPKSSSPHGKLSHTLTNYSNGSPHSLHNAIQPQNIVKTIYFGEKSYEISDYLGNITAVLSDKGLYLDNETMQKVALSSSQDYYPFGMEMPGRSFSSENYRYGFGGHEKDDEVAGQGNHLSFEDYGYDTRIGRRWNVDPMFGKYPHQSPYSAFNGNPIYFVDPTGESGVAYKTDKRNKNGTLILRVVSNIFIYGEGANEAARAAIQSEVSSQYNNNGEFFTAMVDGTEYEIQFEFNTQLIDNTDVDTKIVEGGYGNLKAENNFIEIINDIETSVSLDGVNGGNAGAFKTSQVLDGSNAVSHEVNHLFGGENKDDIEYEVNVNPDITVPRGRTRSPGSRSVSKGNIQEIFNDVNFNGGNTAKVGNARPDKFNKKSKGKYVRIPNSE